MLISFIRTIKIKKRARKTIFDEFEQVIFYDEPSFKGKNFIEYLDTVKETYQGKIIESSIKSNEIEKEVNYHNLMSIMRDFLPLNDWMAALIMFHDKFDKDEYLFKFLKNLERKVFVDWLTGLTIAERLTQIYRIIKLIEDKNNPLEIIKDPMFNEEIKILKSKFKDSLDQENFYSKGNYKIAKYVLLRIDMERNENLHKKVSFSGNITVEHVLPQKPNNYWKRKFTDKAIQEWTNKLGNLTLLNGTKNSRASNKSYGEKIKTYFKKKSDFSVTNELENIPDWNKREIDNRHRRLKREALDIWINNI
ncbi:MAG: HNH endonuclease family protein [Euryarchaeota archaeon]|nr:HNH endonuclease family protein [Euryarchaeota archaeon]MBU4607009.1 HNH endonuclease family protein [Euryarchaeota archaeon]MBV1730364.1 HNH endonuclease family protein [Methanobacterium sp.]MBV1754532.1 HNH endonuclease family protein [Methanobacterium sp.]